MNKDQFVYKIIYSISKEEGLGHLIIKIRSKKNHTGYDYIAIIWECYLKDNAYQEWGYCRCVSEFEDYSLFPLLEKLKQKQINGASKVADVLNFLFENNVEPVVHIKLEGDQTDQYFEGIASATEIRRRRIRSFKGEIMIIPVEKQIELNNELLERQNICLMIITAPVITQPLNLTKKDVEHLRYL